ncbi:MAG: hypothetical protein JNM56_33860, partial [Planctomycetia bacterium]|nr:hypothetical protein [Planctomycetia bacterium]
MTPSVVYQNDFQGAVGSEWSSTATSLTPVGNRQFLGEFGNESVSLALADLPTHNSVTVSFDLFVIRSWDGNNTESNATHGSLGADVWNLTVADGPTLLHTTFSNHNPDPHAPSSRQAYPDAFAGGDYPAYSGAAEVNTLGYLHPTQPIPMDAVYHLTFTFDHVDAALQLNFSAFGLQGLTDESWGLDNVQVAVETLPPPPNVTAILTGDNHY